MIQATSVTKSFGPVNVLRGIDFQAADREVVSIVGASGAGKSTLLQILGSLSRPDTGKVIIDGTDIFSLSSDALADFRNRRIGFVFQFHHLLPTDSPQRRIRRQTAGIGAAFFPWTEPQTGTQARRTLRRGAAAGSHCQGRHQPPQCHSGRRALGQPGQQYQERHPPALLRPPRPLRTDRHHLGPDARDAGRTFLQLGSCILAFVLQIL